MAFKIGTPVVIRGYSIDKGVTGCIAECEHYSEYSIYVVKFDKPVYDEAVDERYETSRYFESQLKRLSA